MLNLLLGNVRVQMSKLVSSVESLESNLIRLISNYKTLQAEYDELKKELESNSEYILKLNTKLERLQHENKTLKTANAMLGSTEYKRETKLKINSLIKEIDSCIVQLAE